MAYIEEERHFRKVLSYPEYMALYASKIDSDTR